MSCSTLTAPDALDNGLILVYYPLTIALKEQDAAAALNVPAL